MATYLDEVINLALEEIAEKSKRTIYQNDFLAWKSDILGKEYYSKMEEIAVTIAHPDNGKTRTAIKSANGTGKSFILSDIGTWWVTAFPPEDSLAIFSANGRDQIERVIFAYLKNNYGYMKTHKHNPIGWINESLEWKFEKAGGAGNESIAFGKRPADQDIVSSFQGTRKRRTLVGFDEMGGLPEDLFTAAEAVTTGGESRFIGIGNPDRRATPFHRLFTNKKLQDEWNLFTISAYELPTLTGEIVYEDPELQQKMLTSGMTTLEWVQHKERAWRSEEPDGSMKPNGLFKAKVLGEFPDEDDSTFFPESDVIRAAERDIEPGEYAVGGVDLGFAGEDESVFMVNRGGHVRIFDGEVAFHDDEGNVIGRTKGTWQGALPMESARRIHAIAMALNLAEVRVDGSGAGVGVYENLTTQREFENREYYVIAVRGGTASSDINMYAKLRDEQHDKLRKLLRDGVLDIDPADRKLQDEMLIITYELNDRGAIKITPKKELKNEFGGSPDRLDALIYAVCDIEYLGGPQPGDIVTYDPDEDLMENHPFYSQMSEFGW